MTAPSSSSGPMRISQRQPKSCVECTRRKTKCDKKHPCTSCCRRGVPEKCRLEQVLPSKTLRTLSGIKRFREETSASHAVLEARIRDLENVIRNSSDCSRLAVFAATDTGAHPMTPHNSISGKERQPLDMTKEDRSEDEDEDEEAEAAVTLEFLALGRTRGKSPGGNGDDAVVNAESFAEIEADWVQDQWLDASLAPLKQQAKAVPEVDHANVDHSNSHSTRSRSVMTTDRSLRAEQPRRCRNELLEDMPDVAVCRKLIHYDVENVSWMHCCYHGPALLSDCDLFLSEIDALDVEPNWGFVALLFAVLASAVHHMPVSDLQALFPQNGNKSGPLLALLFNGCLSSLHRANWMYSHSLYAVQAVAILVSPANHLDKADLYFTMLGTAIRVAQALNLHRLASYSPGKAAEALSIAREVRKRVWYQLVIQDWFHVAFNGCNSIHASQFTTPLPVHIADESAEAAAVHPETPATDLHLIHLSQVARIINTVYTQSVAFRPPPYDIILAADAELSRVLTDTPSWMHDETVELDPTWPAWVQWQRYTFMVSHSHKVILLHRPYLGRAMRGESSFAQSRKACLLQATRILELFQQCELEEFRKTWTVLAHVIAASLVNLVEAADHPFGDSAHLLDPVRAAVDVLAAYAEKSDLSRKGNALLRNLLLTVDNPSNLALSPDITSSDFAGYASRDLERAIEVLRRRRNARTRQNQDHGNAQVDPPLCGSEDTGLAAQDESPSLWNDKSLAAATTESSANERDLGAYIPEESVSADLFDSIFCLSYDIGP